MIRLSKIQILVIHHRIIKETGGESGVRDEGMLDSALANPFQTFDGMDLYPSLQEKAAQLCYGIVKNHPMIDGNKRLGAHALLLFLKMNGHSLQYEQEELSDVILDLASGNCGVADMLQWTIKHEVCEHKISESHIFNR